MNQSYQLLPIPTEIINIYNNKTPEIISNIFNPRTMLQELWYHYELQNQRSFERNQCILYSVVLKS